MVKCFWFELKRAFEIKNIAIVTLFILIMFYTCLSGLNSYKSLLKDEKKFIRYEQIKVKQYPTYEQYGAYGFRVLFHPSPLAIFFNNDFLGGKLTSNIDTKEVIEVNSNHRGKNIFREFQIDFSKAFFIFGTLIMFLFSMNIFRSNKSLEILGGKINVIRHALMRCFILVIFFVTFLYAFFLTATKVFGLAFSKEEISLYNQWVLYSTSLLVLAYLIALTVTCILKFRPGYKYLTVLLWFLLFLFLPEIGKTVLRSKIQCIETIDSLNTKKIYFKE
jgi:hypothetical protein